MRTMKMRSVVIRIKKNDTVKGKRLYLLILDILKNEEISGATVWTGIGGYGKRGESDLRVEGISINMPLVIEVIDELSRLEKILPKIKEIVADNGLITIHEVDMI